MFSRLFLLGLLCAVSGCTTSKETQTARTATEQLLISNAVDQSLSKVDFTNFAGRKIFLDEKYIDAVDKSYVVGSIRHRLMMNGATLSEKKEDSEFTVEVRSGGVGTDSNNMFVGIPELTVPGMVTLPEIRLLNRSSQSGTAKIGLVAYETSSGQVIGDGGLSLAQSDRNDWFFLGMGPYQNGSIKTEIKEADLQQSFTSSKPIPHYVAFDTQGYRPAVKQSPGYDDDSAGRIRLTSEEKPEFK